MIIPMSFRHYAHWRLFFVIIDNDVISLVNGICWMISSFGICDGEHSWSIWLIEGFTDSVMDLRHYVDWFRWKKVVERDHSNVSLTGAQNWHTSEFLPLVQWAGQFIYCGWPIHYHRHLITAALSHIICERAAMDSHCVESYWATGSALGGALLNLIDCTATWVQEAQTQRII